MLMMLFLIVSPIWQLIEDQQETDNLQKMWDILQQE